MLAATVAERLKGSGYATASIGTWHLGDEPYFPEHQGFDRNVGGCDRGQLPSCFSPSGSPTLSAGPSGEFLTDREAAETVNFIEANRDRPFFLYLRHHCVQTPIQARHDERCACDHSRHPATILDLTKTGHAPERDPLRQLAACAFL